MSKPFVVIVAAVLGLSVLTATPATAQMANPSFETGGFTDWTVVSGNAWEVMTGSPPSADPPWYGWDGSHYAWSWAGASSDVGVLRSAVFTLTGDISFVTGGWNKIDANYVTLHLASDGSELDRVYPPDGVFRPFARSYLIAGANLGKDVYIEVVDNDSSSSYAYFCVDDFRLGQAPPAFEDVTAAVGLAPYVDCAYPDISVAWVDFDDDGWADLYHNGEFDGSEGATAYMLRNDEGVGFTDVSAGSCPARFPGIFCDADNDGDQDYYTAVSGGHRGQYVSGALQWDNNVDAHAWQSECSAWGDFNGDGWVDFYRSGWETSPSGPHFPDAIFLHNTGTSHYDRVWWQEEEGDWMSGPGDRRPGRGVTCADFDEDGDLDVYVSNYRLAPNYLWQNDGAGTFADVALAYGVAGTKEAGDPVYSWGHTVGSAWGDLDNDGHLDLFVGNFSHSAAVQDRPQLLRNMGVGDGWRFELMGEIDGAQWTESHASPALADYDNDGDLDIFITAVSGAYTGQKSSLFQNEGNWIFSEVSDAAGLGLATPQTNFQAAWADYDHDGDLDLFTGRRLYRNGCSNGNHWLAVEIVGDGVNVDRDGIGTIVRIPVDGGANIMTRQVETATGWGNQNEMTLHFGLGSNADPVAVEVTWLDGSVQTFSGVSVDDLFVVEYGVGGEGESEGEGGQDCPDCLPSVRTEYDIHENACLGVQGAIDPSSLFQWHKDSEPLSEGRHIGVHCPILRIPNLMPEDAGIYSCTYDDGAKAAAVYSITITVAGQVPVAGYGGLCAMTALCALAAVRRRRRA